MPDRLEILRALYGAWRLAKLDPGGMGWFDLSVEGFWRSFFAALLVAPGYALMVGLRQAESPLPAPILAIVVVQGLAYAVGWLVFPLISLVATRLLGLTHRYVPLIVAVNWAAALQMALFVVALLVQGLLPPALGGFVVALTTLAILFYQWFVVRTALETTGVVALALLLLDLLLNTFVSMTADGLLA